MSDVAVLDFQEILAHPALTYDEGLRFFRGVGLMNTTLRRLAADLDAHGIAYSVIGAIALNQHGYQRFTQDIDLLMTPEGLQKFRDKLIGRGYRLGFAGATKTFRATIENVPIEVITTGEYPGDGKPKSVVFPDPGECFVEINGVRTVPLEKLVELKLASGMTGLGRRRDLADVQDLIRLRELDASLADKLDPMVQSTYLELHAEVVGAQQQADAPGRE